MFDFHPEKKKQHCFCMSGEQALVSNVADLWLSYPFNDYALSPTVHIFMHSAHVTYVGASLPQCLLLRGQHTWRELPGLHDI